MVPSSNVSGKKWSEMKPQLRKRDRSRNQTQPASQLDPNWLHHQLVLPPAHSQKIDMLMASVATANITPATIANRNHVLGVNRSSIRNGPFRANGLATRPSRW